MNGSTFKGNKLIEAKRNKEPSQSIIRFLSTKRICGLSKSKSKRWKKRKKRKWNRLWGKDSSKKERNMETWSIKYLFLSRTNMIRFRMSPEISLPLLTPTYFLVSQKVKRESLIASIWRSLLTKIDLSLQLTTLSHLVLKNCRNLRRKNQTSRLRNKERLKKLRWEDRRKIGWKRWKAGAWTFQDPSRSQNTKITWERWR